MTPLYQGDGDCFRTCVASLLGCEDRLHVPDFFAHVPPDQSLPRQAIDALNDWLRVNHGVVLWDFALGYASLKETLAHVRETQPLSPYILGGRTRRGSNHAVIAVGDKIVHDPAPNSSGLTGPTSDGCFWISILAKYL